MLNPEERRFVYDHACVPEQLPDYVEAVSGMEALLVGRYVCFTGREHLTFVGYPLGRADEPAEDAFQKACDRFEPASARLVASKIRLPGEALEQGARDQYYRLALPVDRVPPDAAYMVRRAGRELLAREGTYGRTHRKIVKAFLSRGHLSGDHRRIFENIPRYLEQARTARVLEAWKEETLAAFDILDLGSARYGFYLFNFRAPKINVPGASDLLVQGMIELAQREGKTALNLGLGIHAGIRRFKEKWGGEPFLDHASATVRRKDTKGLGSLAKKL